MPYDVICMGEVLLDFVSLDRDAPVGEALHFEKAPGGAPANVAVGLAKLGHRVAFVTQLGQDPFGYFLKQVLDEQQVDTTMIRFTDEANTMLAFVAVQASGERSFAFYRKPSADMLLRPTDLDPQKLQSTRIFHYGSITLANEPSRSATERAIQYAQQGGALISYDPNLRTVLWPSKEAAKQDLLHGMQFADLIKMNEDEVAFLTGGDLSKMTVEDLVMAARQLWTDRSQLMIITRGWKGCIALNQHDMLQVDGFEIEVEDTIGAGDGFMAGLLSACVGAINAEGRLDFDERWKDILREANAVGALTASKRGAIPALPDAGTLHQFLQKV